MAAYRLQRWAIIVFLHLQYPTTKHANADTLSRLPIAAGQQVQQDCCLTLELDLIHSLQLEQLLLETVDIAKATKSDTILSQVYHFIQDGWPKHKSDIAKVLHPYFVRRLQLTVQSGCILNGLQVVIPSSLRTAVMTELHEAHTGIVKMKSVTWMYICRI